jgi:hypothetical protein
LEQAANDKGVGPFFFNVFFDYPNPGFAAQKFMRGAGQGFFFDYVTDRFYIKGISDAAASANVNTVFFTHSITSYRFARV